MEASNYGKHNEPQLRIDLPAIICIAPVTHLVYESSFEQRLFSVTVFTAYRLRVII